MPSLVKAPDHNQIVKLFSLPSLGINTNRFVNFALPVFSMLHMDPYDAKRNKVAFLKNRFPESETRLDHFLPDYYEGKFDLEPVVDLIARLNSADRGQFDRIGLTARRKRAIAKFELTNVINQSMFWDIVRVPASEFKQAVSKNDPRSLVRRFRELPQSVVDNLMIRYLLLEVARMTKSTLPDLLYKFEITMHWMYTFADVLNHGDNAPEGIHQDGADFIVSALVIERAGILGGESVVYELDKKTEIFRHTLQVGEGIFQNDRRYYHYVTPIKEDPSVEPSFGNRSIIGFDINVM